MSIRTSRFRSRRQQEIGRIEQIFVGLPECWQAWLDGYFPAANAHEFRDRLAFAEPRTLILEENLIPRTLVDAFNGTKFGWRRERSNRSQDADLDPLVSPLHYSGLFQRTWAGFLGTIEVADASDRVAWRVSKLTELLQENRNARRYQGLGRWQSLTARLPPKRLYVPLYKE